MRPSPKIPRRNGKRFGFVGFAAALFGLFTTASAKGYDSRGLVLLMDEKPSDGTPMVVLDRLVFPRDVLGASDFEAHLKRALRREASRADWGAGRENRIEYRFSVTELKYTLIDGALRAHCAAVGRLPGGQTAKSELSFSGHPSERTALTKRVLEIVARGVITRLAELERRRRGLR